MNILLAGSTGLIGRNYLDLALAEPRINQAYAIVRNSSGVKNSKLIEVKFSFEELEKLQLPAIDAAVCCLGTTIKTAGSQDAFARVDRDYVLAFAEKALQLGARKFLVVSALGADPQSSVFYSKIKGQVEQRLKDLSFESLVIVRPSLLLGERKESRPAERAMQMLAPVLNPILVGRLRKYRAVSAAKVAAILMRETLAQEKGLKTVETAG